MKYRLVDLLACPICKDFPLMLKVFSQEDRYSPSNVRRCELYCAYHQGMVQDLPETRCIECYRFEVTNGLLVCNKCNRWYPIIDDIPIMLPDDLRNRNRDLEFLRRWKDRIPSAILESGKPYGLS
ncbi:MAG: Trm112 family protein [Aigarchaeota archaeon]|nr:Trm112 family protein [Aigarchaeota archaeon]MDW8092334.1 Trm112 family protein [Nitrososphaerota archaeon]